MKEALIVTSSAQGESSVSGQLAQEFERQLRSVRPGIRIVRRDVGAEPLPHLRAETVAGIRAEPVTRAEQETRALSNALIAELESADFILLTSPMYNFGMSSTLKTWFDHVLRAGITFRYTDAGPEGLLKNKRAVVIESRAGIYSQGASAPMDSQEPHLRTLLSFMGIEDVSWVRAEGLAFGPDAAARSIETAKSTLHEIAALVSAPDVPAPDAPALAA